MPIVNLLDSYKVYHKVDPPHLWKSLVKLASLVMFFFFFPTDCSSWYSCAHTHLLCALHAFIRLSSLHSPSLSIRSGTTFSNVDFPPFSSGNLHIFWILFSVFPVFVCLSVSPAPKFYSEKAEKDPPFLQKKKKALFSQMTSSIWALMDQALGVLCYPCVNVCVACLYLKCFIT